MKLFKKGEKSAVEPDEPQDSRARADGAEAAVEAAGTAPRRRSRKVGIVAGVTAAVVVVAGAGLLAWHDQPSFCGAICHTPMDAYYATYAEGTADKYGNELDEAGSSAMLVVTHKNEGYGCMDCHVPTLSEQVTEGLSWVTGGYEIAGVNASGQAVLDTRELSDLVEACGIEEEQFCLNDSCHVGEDGTPLTREDLIKATEGLDETYNPHEEHHGEVACSSCHKAHAQSVNYCTSCHGSAPVPDGWLSASKAKTLQKTAS